MRSHSHGHDHAHHYVLITRDFCYEGLIAEDMPVGEGKKVKSKTVCFPDSYLACLPFLSMTERELCVGGAEGSPNLTTCENNSGMLIQQRRSGPIRVQYSDPSSALFSSHIS